jgi:hypothetical protein
VDEGEEGFWNVIPDDRLCLKTKDVNDSSFPGM